MRGQKVDYIRVSNLDQKLDRQLVDEKLGRPLKSLNASNPYKIQLRERY